MERTGKTSAAKLPAALYMRISRDKAGAGLGVERQQADCAELAKRLGWDVAAVYVDNDISAYSGKVRPQYRAMLDAVRAGQIRGVIAWHTDRLHRRATELEEFVTIAEAHHLQIQTVTAGTLDLSSASGRMVARMLGAAAQHEIDHARERMKAAKSQMATQGKYRGGPRPYGYDADGCTIREDEAAVIREATAAILAGRTLAAVARELNERGVTTSTGKPWTYMRLRDVLIRPRNAGLLHHGRADRGEAEIVGRAVWPAIVDEDTWRAVHSTLIDPARRLQDGNEPRWLGSGIYSCGQPGCTGTLRAAPFGATASNRRRTRKYHYRCTASAHLTVAAAPTDDFVRGVVAELIRDPRVVAAIAPHAAGDEQTAADRERRHVLAARLAQFENDYALGTVTGAQLDKATKTVMSEMDEIDARLATAMRQSASSPVLSALDPGAAFLAAPLDIQRAILRAVLRVEVVPTLRRGSAWSPERLHVTPVVAV